MTLSELIDHLQNLMDTDEADGTEVVMFAHQPSYPLQCAVNPPVVLTDEDGVTEGERVLRDSYDATEDAEEMTRLERLLAEAERARPRIVYLSEGSYRPRRADGSEMSPYAPREAWNYE